MNSRLGHWSLVIGHFLNSFLFEERSTRQAGLFRILFALSLLLSLSLFMGHVREFFTDDGFAPNSLIANSKQAEALLGLAAIHSPEMVILLFWLLVGCCLLLVVGWQSRLVAIAIWLLLNLFHARNPSILYGGDSVLRVMSFFAMFLPLGQSFSRFARDPNQPTEVWPYRLAQIQIVELYAFNGFYKLQGDKWLRGESLFTILNNDNFNVFNFWWLKDFPLLINLGTWFFFFAVLSFPILVWWKTTRPVVLIWMTLGHLGIALLTNVNYFSLIMISTYVLFLDDEEFDRLFRFLKRLPILRELLPVPGY